MIPIIFLVITIIEVILLSSLISNHKERNRVALILFTVQFFVFFAFRDSNVLADTHTYAYFFNRINDHLPFYHIKPHERLESGYVIYQQFIHRYISSSFLVFNIINTAIVLTAIMLFLYRNSSRMMVSLFLLVATLQVYYQFIAIRQGIAMSILLLSHPLLEKRKFLLYFLAVLIAYTFHFSALLMVLFILFYKYPRQNKRIKYLAIGGAVVLFVSLQAILTFYYRGAADTVYLDKSAEKGFFSAVGIFNTANALVLYVYSNYLKKHLQIDNDEVRQESNTLSLVCLLNLIVALLSIRMFVFSRFSIYLLPYIIAYISNLYGTGSKIQGKYNALTALYLVASYIFYVLYRPEWIGLETYHFYG